jgi:riboflavin synthase
MEKIVKVIVLTNGQTLQSPIEQEGAEIGGHPISGHVDCVASIIKIDTPPNNTVVTIKVPPQWIRYIFNKGYVALNGTSLTVSSLDKAASTFQVWFIPETLRMTTFGEKKEGDDVNLEIDRGTQVVVDTIRDFLEERFGGAQLGLTEALPEQLLQLGAFGRHSTQRD